jgi:bacillithiol biosynthesis deacetylase BshB1
VTQPVDVLAIAAHPDDAEVGCGGALLLAADAGHRVGVADLTAGELSTAGSAEQRARERDRASELLSLSERVGLDLPDAALGTDVGHRDALVQLLRELRPRVVLAPHTEDRHPDHAAAGRLTREACFLAGVAKLGRGRPHRPERLYHYGLHHPFEPTFVLDVSAVWERRMEAVSAYESQFGHAEDRRLTEVGQPAFLELLTARAAVYGAMVGVARGEPYRSRGPLPAGGLPGLEDVQGDRQPAYRVYL